MLKVYNRIEWENYPSDKTPVNEENLNKIDRALDEIDDRTINLNTVKLDKTEASVLVKTIAYEEATGIFTVTLLNGSSFIIDTKLEKITMNWTYDEETQQIVLTLNDGTKQYIDLSALITQYEFLDSDTIGFQLEGGKVKAILKEGSIEEKHLRPNYLADIRVEVAKAQLSASAADASQKAAAASAEAAATSETNTKASEEAAAASAQTASDKALAAATSEANAKSYAKKAQESANAAETARTAAEEQANLAAGSVTTATELAGQAANSAAAAEDAQNAAEGYADTAGESATLAGTHATNAQKYAEQCEKLVEGFEGGLIPMGTITFAQLSGQAAKAGYMYNISDEFTTDATFKEGTGHTYPAGTNVYLTGDGVWDCLAGTPVASVNGKKGNVTLAASDVGALPSGGTAANSLKIGGYTIKVLTEAAYQALATKDANTFYVRPKEG